MVWYTRPAALKIIQRLRANPPERKFERDRHSRNYHDGKSDYVGYDVIALRSMFAKAFAKGVDLSTNADEVLAALFGDPNNLDEFMPTAFADRIARRAAMAADIDAALAERLAA